MTAVEVKNINKSYGHKEEGVQALHDISFSVSTSELFGIIGPDGAGKTSLFRILTTLLLPDSGQAIVDGTPVVEGFKKLRQKIGYMPGRFSLYQDLTVEENLQFFATLFKTSVQENYELIKDIYVQIEPFRSRRAGKLSGGMKQKLALCCALIHRPVVLFLDEPTTGVDAVSRKEFWEMLQKLKAQQITILVSTPYMDEASRCDRVALLQSGRILTIDKPAAITTAFTNPLLAVCAEGAMLPLLQALKKMPEVTDAYPFGEYHHVVMQPDYDRTQLEQALRERFPKLEMKEVEPDIEDCFIALMKAN